jgi:alpha-N-arabinofuranosidase
LTLATPENGPVVTDTVELDRYAGEILLRAAWLEGEYVFEWSPDGKSAYRELGRLPGDALLSRGYTGAYLGLYATANGSQNTDFADFDRVRYSTRSGLEAADGR